MTTDTAPIGLLAGAGSESSPSAGSPRTRVLLVLTSLARTSGGGTSFAEGLSTVLASSPAVDLVMVLPTGFGGDDARLPTGVDVCAVAPVVGMARIVRDLVMIRRWARRTAADVVVVPHEWAAPTGGIPLVNVIQNVLYLDKAAGRRGWLRTVLMRAIARHTSRFATTTVAVSRSAADSWTACTGHGAVVVPQGISDRYRPSEIGQREDLLVVLSGQATYKNPHLARETIRLVRARGLRSTIVLVGPATPSYSFATTEVEWLSPDELASLFRRARAVLLTSTVESFGLPAFEAAACGATVIVATGTAMAEWLAPYDNVLVVPAQEGRFTDAVMDAMARPDQSRIAVDNFTWDKIGPRWLDVIASATPSANASASHNYHR